MMQKTWVKAIIWIIAIIIVAIIINTIVYAYHPEWTSNQASSATETNTQYTAAGTNWWTANIRLPVIHIGTNGISIKIPIPNGGTNNAAIKK